VAKLQQKRAAAANLGYRDNVAFVGVLSTQLWHDAFVQRSVSHQNLNAA
jgi:asparagine synthase (glutamine-hydrolysing)